MTAYASIWLISNTVPAGKSAVRVWRRWASFVSRLLLDQRVPVKLRIPLSAALARHIATLALVLLPGLSVAAQSARARATFDAFRDSVTTTSDSTVLRELNSRLILSAKRERSNALLHAELGFVSLRLADLGDARRYDDAASEFKWTTELAPNWSYAWYGLALAECALSELQPANAATRPSLLGRDARSRAVAAFAQTAKVDPRETDRLVALAMLSVRQHANVRATVVLEGLRRLTVGPTVKSARFWLARGRLERILDESTPALASFENYRRTGDNRSLALLELARTRFLLGQLEGNPLYYQGAASDDSVTSTGYHADLNSLLSDSLLAVFDTARGADRSRFLEAFWTQRDHADLRTEGERLREHYRRLYYVRRNFSIPETGSPYDPTATEETTAVDERGRIYLRHGEPDTRATLSAAGVEPNESWRYARAAGDLVFHFVARVDRPGYSLIESVFDVASSRTAATLSTTKGPGSSGGFPDQLLRSRESLSAFYRGARLGETARGRNFETRERAVGHASISLGIHTDSFEPRFAKEAGARLQVLVAGRDSAGSIVHLVYALPAVALSPTIDSVSASYAVHLRFTALRPDGTVAAGLDTLHLERTPEILAGDRYLLGRATVHVPAGQLVYRLSVETGDPLRNGIGGAGTVSGLDTLIVSSPTAEGLTMSDLVVGARNPKLFWVPVTQAADTVFFSALATFRKSDRLEVFTQVAGMVPGRKYRGTIRLQKRGGGDAVLTQKFDGMPERGVTSVRQMIELKRVKPGSFDVVLAVVDGSGAQIQRVQSIEVVGQ